MTPRRHTVEKVHIKHKQRGINVEKNKSNITRVSKREELKETKQNEKTGTREIKDKKKFGVLHGSHRSWRINVSAQLCNCPSNTTSFSLLWVNAYCEAFCFARLL